MKWRKLQHIFCPDRNFSWMVSHASYPTAELIAGDVFRIYFSCRNEGQVSSIGSIDVELRPPYAIAGISSTPVLSAGSPGTFDDSGVSLGCLTRIGNKKHLYYVGWNLAVTVPWRNSIGLAMYDEEHMLFRKVSMAPIMDRADQDPYSLSYPFVLEDGAVIKMWYGSNLSWGRTQAQMMHVIKYAESQDGLKWDRKNVVAIGLKNDGEYAVSKPFVMKRSNGAYAMWYSYRGESYRIGYAESSDGISWNRKDEEAGIGISESGWDSEMVCYPFIFDHKGERYMLYNGNGYGKTGFGIAVLERA